MRYGPSNLAGPMFRAIRLAICGVAMLLVVVSTAEAARPIVDLHTLDAYFALYAADSNVPWKATAVRLDTYSSAEVDFAAYQVDPADVVTAGSNARSRPVDTAKLKPVATWRYTPPGGYQFQTSMVAVPLGPREGFFVVEARRGAAAEQVWVNRTRVGLIVKQTPAELTLYAADLGTGRALPKMRVQFLSGARLETRLTDAHGLVRWTSASGPRPVFALAQWGASYAFVSPLPQAPLPTTIVAVRTDSAVVHAGDTVRVAGFVRTRRGTALRAASGNVQIALRDGPALIAQTNAGLDAAGAFATSFAIPGGARAGEYAILASADGGVGGATVHVDGNAAGLALAVTSRCGGLCPADADVPLRVRATRGGAAAANVQVRVTIVRSPHVGGDETAAWGVTPWLDATVATGEDGTADVVIPHPTDGLASTYGVTLVSGAATANTRVIVPTARFALRVASDRDRIALGTPAGYSVVATDIASGRPAGAARVTVELRHGSDVSRQQLDLDAAGRGRGSFGNAPLGTSLVVASATVDGATATDAAQVEVAAQADDASTDDSSAGVRVATDRALYRTGDAVRATATDAGAAGDVLLGLESALGAEFAVVPSTNGAASASFRIADAPGAMRVGAAFVRDGALEWNVVPVALDAPGRSIAGALGDVSAPMHPGATVAVPMPGGAGTVIVRVSRGAPSGGAAFESAPGLLDVDVTSTVSSAPADAVWHPWVDASGQHAPLLGFSRRSQPPQDATLAQADTRAVSWKVARATAAGFELTAPSEAGRYVLSVLRIDDDGRVTAATSNIEVR